MLPVRVAFDPDLPVVASQAIPIGGHTFASGDVIDWRALGVDEEMLYAWWLSGLVHHPLPSATEMPGVTDPQAATALEQREHSARKKQPRAAR